MLKDFATHLRNTVLFPLGIAATSSAASDQFLTYEMYREQIAAKEYVFVRSDSMRKQFTEFVYNNENRARVAVASVHSFS